MKRSPIIFTALFALLSLTLFCPGWLHAPRLSPKETPRPRPSTPLPLICMDSSGTAAGISFSRLIAFQRLSLWLTRGLAATQNPRWPRLLHFSLEKAKINGSFRALNEQVLAAGGKKGIELNIANALWAEKSFSLKKEFLETVQVNYQGGFRQIDLMHAPEAARKTINSWVEEQTKNKIKDLMGPGSISSDTRLVITNAIYFKGLWNSQFEKKLTKQDKFTLLDGKEIKVPMMTQTKPLGYAQKEELQILEMPYKGEALSMVVLLPSKQKNFDEFERSLTSDKLHRWTRMLPMRLVEVHFPKFKMDSAYWLRRTLKKLGMINAFSADADFSGMTGKKKLFIEKALHKAFVEVKEEGTEAAAATVVIVERTGMARPKPIPVFRADHPFVFLIWHKPSRCILFMGRVVKP